MLALTRGRTDPPPGLLEVWDAPQPRPTDKEMIAVNDTDRTPQLTRCGALRRLGHSAVGLPLAAVPTMPALAAVPTNDPSLEQAFDRIRVPGTTSRSSSKPWSLGGSRPRLPPPRSTAGGLSRRDGRSREA